MTNTEILYAHFNNILEYIKNNWDETDSTYYVYILISDYFYYLDNDLWKQFKTIKFDCRFIEFVLDYNETDLKVNNIHKRAIVYNIVKVDLFGTAQLKNFVQISCAYQQSWTQFDKVNVNCIAYFA